MNSEISTSSYIGGEDIGCGHTISASTASRPISEVKLDQAGSSTGVGDHPGTPGAAIFFFSGASFFFFSLVFGNTETRKRFERNW